MGTHSLAADKAAFVQLVEAEFDRLVEAGGTSARQVWEAVREKADPDLLRSIEPELMRLGISLMMANLAVRRPAWQGAFR